MSENIQKARLQAVKKYRISKVTPKGAIPDERMFNQTIFNLDTKNLNQAKVIEQAKEIQKHGFKNVQLVLENWEAHLGDLEFDGTRFPDSKALTSELHKLGFIVKLVINSFVSEKSKLFNKHAEFLIHDPANKTHPYTFNWTTHGTGAILNYGPYNDRYWLADHMRDLHKYEGVDSYRFDGGDLGQFGAAESFHSISGYEHYPNDYTKDFASTAERLGSLVEVDAAYHSQYWPISIQMRPIEADWAALKSIIPAASTIGLAGYPFIVAPTFKADSKPSEELYIRWLQLITFFPSMQLSVAPWNVSAKAANLSNHFAALHLEHSQTIIAIARDASVNGEPLLRPLWYLAADDSRTFTIGDQFAVGNDIIIAPVLVQGQRERSVYLPKGTWLDQHGNSYVGPKEIKVLTPLEELPYFKRKIQ